MATTLSLQNPVFWTYALASSFMLLKLLLQPWMTVVRMLKVNGGFRNPEDLKKSPANPSPHPGQLETNDYVERSRRLNQNDLESIPAFLFAGLMFVLAGPPLILAQVLFWTYVVARAAHFLAYVTAQLHDIRAAFWSVSSIAVLGMVGYTIVQIVSA